MPRPLKIGNKLVHDWKSEAKSIEPQKWEEEETPHPGTTLMPNSKLRIIQTQPLVAAVKGNDKLIQNTLKT